MQFEPSNLITVLPEIFILTMACVVLVVDVFISEKNRILSYGMTQVTLLATVGITLVTAVDQPVIAFDGNVIRDAMSDLLKVSILLVSAVAFLYAKDYLRDRDLFKGEFYVIGLFAVLGMMVMVSANGFLTVYLGLELLSLSLYTMVAFDRDSKIGSEAAMKYFVLGAIASGMLLYGISMIYGATSVIDFPSVAQALSTTGMDNMVLVFGLVFLMIGLAFKFGAVPFHMWMPDVYHGAPAATTLFVSTAPKVAAFAMAMRILVDGMSELHADWQGMLVILAVLSMAVGNIVAIAQANIKRMLAYSTISHVGFIFLGLLAGTQSGYSSAMFYAIVYAIMSLGGFGIVMLLSSRGFEAENLSDYKGLNDRNPWFAGMMLLVMFSMAGVPPTVGFFAKMVVLEAVIATGMTWLAIVGVAFSIIGAFYYLRIVKLMYFDKPEEGVAEITASTDTKVMLSVNGLAMLVLGMFPAGLLGLCAAALS